MNIAGRIGRAVLVLALLLPVPGAMAREEAEALAAPVHGPSSYSGAASVQPSATERRPGTAGITAFSAPHYPPTRRDSLIEHQFGEDLADPDGRPLVSEREAAHLGALLERLEADGLLNLQGHVSDVSWTCPLHVMNVSWSCRGGRTAIPR